MKLKFPTEYPREAAINCSLGLFTGKTHMDIIIDQIAERMFNEKLRREPFLKYDDEKRRTARNQTNYMASGLYYKLSTRGFVTNLGNFNLMEKFADFLKDPYLHNFYVKYKEDSSIGRETETLEEFYNQGGNLTGAGAILDMKNGRKVLFKEFYTEKSIIGLIEFIHIDEIGDCKCKVDSGNEGYNVLHAVNVSISGDTVEFTTINCKRLKKKKVGEITVITGKGFEEKRPVIQLNVKIGNKFYQDIPFSLCDRSKADEKILLGEPFIRKIDALIDVSKNRPIVEG